MPYLKRLRAVDWIFLALFLVSGWLFLSPSARAPLREFFAPPEKKILSVASGPITPNGSSRVFKVKTPAGLFVEAYGPIKDGYEPLISRLRLPDIHNAYFQVLGRATDLALKDVDGDQIFEIIAPSMDGALVPHLNIFRYNKDSKQFEPFTE